MAGSRAGLRKVQKTVRTKKGTARRSYWVKGSQAAKRPRTVQPGGLSGVWKRHSGKIIAGAGIAIAAALLATQRQHHAKTLAAAQREAAYQQREATRRAQRMAQDAATAATEQTRNNLWESHRARMAAELRATATRANAARRALFERAQQEDRHAAQQRKMRDAQRASWR